MSTVTNGYRVDPSAFAEPKKSQNTLTKAAQLKNENESKEKLLLPEYLGLKASMFAKLFLKPCYVGKFRAKRRPSLGNVSGNGDMMDDPAGLDDGLGENDYDYENPNDMHNYVPNVHGEDGDRGVDNDNEPEGLKKSCFCCFGVIMIFPF